MRDAARIGAIGKALGHSLDGIAAALRERAFVQELVVIVPLTIAAWLLPVTAIEATLLTASLLAILVVELLNTGIESITDLASPERHPLAKRAKDAGSAAVLVTIAIAAIVWGSVLWTHYWPADPARAASSASIR